MRRRVRRRTARLRRKRGSLRPPSRQLQLAFKLNVLRLGEDRRVRCSTALSPAARPPSRRACERAMARIRRHRKPRVARRAMTRKRATIDETTELSSARREGATECGAAAEGGCHGGRRALRPSGWFGARGQGVGIRGRTKHKLLHSGFGLGSTPQQTKHPRCISKVWSKRHASTQVSALPALLFASDRISWEGSHNLISGAPQESINSSENGNQVQGVHVPRHRRGRPRRLHRQ
jgi:hypothetical protein